MLRSAKKTAKKSCAPAAAPQSIKHASQPSKTEPVMNPLWFRLAMSPSGGSTAPLDQPPPVQAKLEIHPPEDRLEREADAMAGHVLRKTAPDGGGPRQDAAPDEGPQVVRDTPGSTGRPLETPVRRELEWRFGQDLTKVRVHTDNAPPNPRKGSTPSPTPSVRTSPLHLEPILLTRRREKSFWPTSSRTPFSPRAASREVGSCGEESPPRLA